MAGGKKQKGNLDPSALFTDVNNYLSAELSQLLYIVVTICLLIGWKPTVNSGEQRNLQIVH